MIKSLRLYNFIVELELPENINNVSNYKLNNIKFYNENHIYLYDISMLLKDYSKKNNLGYTEEVYFDIKITEDNLLFCQGYVNHCKVNVLENQIVKIINNR